MADARTEQSFLGGLEARDLRTIEELGVHRSWEAGEYLLREGDRPGNVLFLLDGLVKIVKTAPSGHEVLLELRRAGDVVGEFGAMDGKPRAASVVSITEVAAIAVPADRFNHLLETNARIAHRALVMVVARVRAASERQLEMGTLDVTGRVCRRIVEMAMESGTGRQGVAVIRNVSQQDIADWAGISRDGVVRALKELRDRGWVKTGRQQIEVLDLFALSRRAEG